MNKPLLDVLDQEHVVSIQEAFTSGHILPLFNSTILYLTHLKFVIRLFYVLFSTCLSHPTLAAVRWVEVLRRHPSQRWALDGSIDLPELQLEILSEASRLVHKGGRLVYATCSLLGEENQVRGWGWMLGWGSVVLESWAEEGRKA